MAGCLNGGSCLFDKEKDAFACSCNLQWSGEKCELGKFLVFQGHPTTIFGNICSENDLRSRIFEHLKNGIIAHF